MDKFDTLGKEYLKNLDTRARQSKVYRSYQAIGLELATTLHDFSHTSLYIKIAKEHDDYERLLGLAKSIAERPNVKNKGAYFMRLLFDGGHGKEDSVDR